VKAKAKRVATAMRTRAAAKPVLVEAVTANVARQAKLPERERAAQPGWTEGEEEFALLVQVQQQVHLITPPPGILCWY
jgi:anti-sigma factor RsiW